MMMRFNVYFFLLTQVSALTGQSFKLCDKTYHLQEELGSGAYGHVYKAVEIESGKLYAVKTMLYTHASMHVIQNELNILPKLPQHPNLAAFFCSETFYYDRYTPVVFVVMEYYSGGDVMEYMEENGKFDERTTWMIFKQLAAAMEALYNSNIMHRDIKLENMMLTGPDINTATIKLIDFGFAIVLNPKTTVKSRVGTPQYCRLRGRAYGYESDVWSAGIVLYGLIEDQYLFGEDENPKYIEEMREYFHQNRKAFAPSLDRGLLNYFIGEMLQKNPRRRMKITEMFKIARNIHI